MANERNNNDNTTGNFSAGRGERGSSVPNDLPDRSEDQDKLKSEETFIDLPDVKDIPGQEFVHTAPLGELADTTISSDDEEGRGVFDLDDSEDFTPGTEGDVSRDEREALRDTTYMPTRDENNLRQARMDNVDFEGEPLNERGFGQELSGADLDSGDISEQARTESMSQGDEENKHYSVDDTDRDQPNENRTGA